jgi:hypothetical protein
MNNNNISLTAADDDEFYSAFAPAATCAPVPPSARPSVGFASRPPRQEYRTENLRNNFLHSPLWGNGNNAGSSSHTSAGWITDNHAQHINKRNSVLNEYIKHLTKRDVRFLNQFLKQKSKTENSHVIFNYFFPAFGFTLGEYAVFRTLNWVSHYSSSSKNKAKREAARKTM